MAADTHAVAVDRRRRQVALAGEVGWLMASTILFVLCAIRLDGAWRFAFVAVLLVDLGVTGCRVRVRATDLRRDQPAA